MRVFGRIETGFWQNQKVKALSERSRLLLAYLFTCPHGNAIGCFVLPIGYVMADIKWPEAVAEKHVKELCDAGHIERDSESGLTRIIGWFGHNKIENPNVAKAAGKQIAMLPQSSEVFESFLTDLIRNAEQFPNGVREELAKLFPERFRNRFNNGLCNGSIDGIGNQFETKEPKPKPKPKPEPEPEPEREREKENIQSGSSSESMPDTARTQAAPPPGFHERYAEVRQRVETLLNSPSLTVFGRVDAWLKQGADPDEDIYPTLIRLKPKWSGRDLTYFDGAIADCIATRNKPMPEGQPRAGAGFNAMDYAEKTRGAA